MKNFRLCFGMGLIIVWVNFCQVNNYLFAQNVFDNLKARYGNAIVLISCQGEKGKLKPTSVGTGFIIGGENYVLTNSHVITGNIKDLKNIKCTGQVETDEALGKSLSIIKRDVELDIALLRFALEYGKSEPDWGRVIIGDSNELRSDHSVKVLGFPEGEDLSSSPVSSIINTTGDKGSIKTGVAVNPGNSGGPVFNKFGKVIGIVQGGKTGAQGINHFIPINFARNLINLTRPYEKKF